MIVVVGSRHDSVATDLVALWPEAALCSAEDLVSPGWVWRLSQPASRIWIVDSKPVSDDQITGVFLRRATVYPEELKTTHPDDRAYLASENHAFLTFVLATTSALVVNPVNEGTFGEHGLRQYRWIKAAAELGIPVRPLRVTSEERRQAPYRTFQVEVAGNEVLGDAPPRVLDATRLLAQALEISWGVFIFDRRYRLVTVTAARRPTDSAAAALGDFLKAGCR
jgi:hypothetical protein